VNYYTLYPIAKGVWDYLADEELVGLEEVLTDFVIGLVIEVFRPES
jgi:hypothetical protein